MATQQIPEPGRSYSLAPRRFAPGLEPRPIDVSKREWITARGQDGPHLPSKRKPASGVRAYPWKAGPKRPGTNGGSLKGLRGPRPKLIGIPVEVRNCTDAGGVIRRQRRALGHTADVVGPAVRVWPANLLDIERGREVQLTTLIRILDGLGLRLLVAPKAEE